MNLAVLLLIFNRPALTAKVIKRLGEIRPTRLYLAGDGPRKGRENERARCEEARRIASEVTWPCEIRTLWRDSNLGCKRAVSEAISWFFLHEEEGVILEDDCLPHLDFFRFCSHGLNRFRNDGRIYVITGDNFQDGASQTGRGASYYFSKYPHCWGWATWRRAWQAYDGDLAYWDDWVQSPAWKELHNDPIERSHWERLGTQVRNGSLNSWATPWMFSVWYNRGLTMTPDVNLVTNIGFGPEATHTINWDKGAAQLPACAIGDILDVSEVRWNQAADHYVFHNHFGGRNLRLPRSILIWVKRILSPFFKKAFGNGN